MQSEKKRELAVNQHPQNAPITWSQSEWDHFDQLTRKRALRSRDERKALLNIIRAARRVMASYTTSFYLVSRFLPLQKRNQVELIYAAVRYPDEVVDSFPLMTEERFALLDRWESGYEAALENPSLKTSLEAGISPFVAAFAGVVRQTGIPPEHYRSFLAAMRSDARPESFGTIRALIDDYIYGSAIVIGYFLAFVYGPSTDGRMDETLEASRELGIGLQLTNFVRDVLEDQRRGRLYMPLDLLRARGVDPGYLDDPQTHNALVEVIHQVATIAEEHYRRAEKGLDAFAPDCRVAIRACIAVYRALNQRIENNPDCLEKRESVPAHEKWQCLPVSKYWRIPFALIMARI